MCARRNTDVRRLSQSARTTGGIVAGATGSARWWVSAAAVLSGAVVVCLVSVAVFANLDAADRLASVAGAAVGAIGLFVTVVQLARSGNDVRVAGARSVQSGGSIGRAVTGDRNRLETSAPTTPTSPSVTPPFSNSTIPGDRGISAAGSIGEAVTGDGNDES
jgi:hypothetical protein